MSLSCVNPAFFKPRRGKNCQRPSSACSAYVKVRSWPEAESFSSVPEQHVKRRLIQAQSEVIARAMASICNDEQGPFSVMSGHGRNTLSLFSSLEYRRLLTLAAHQHAV